jgi:hypothetical protein
MSGRAVRAVSRVVFFLCGAASLFTTVPYLILRGAGLPREGEWIVFLVVLAALGLFSVGLAVLPRSWIASVGKRDRDDPQLFTTPLKWLGVFAVIFYLVAVVAYLAPSRWNLDAQLMFLLCPMYFLKQQFDPSLPMTFFLLGPLNAGVFGALGLSLRCVSWALGKRPSR